MVVAQPGSGLSIAHGQRGLPDSWPGLQGVSVWSPYPRCPARVWAVEFGASFSSAAADPSAVRCPEPDGGVPRSVVLSSEKGLEESFPAEKSGALVREGVVEEAPFEGGGPFNLFFPGYESRAQTWRLPAGLLGATGLPHLDVI